MKMVARRCSETSVYFYHTTRCHISGDCLLPVDFISVATYLDVGGFRVAKCECLPLEVTHDVTRDGAGQVRSSDRETTAGSCRF